MSTAFESPVVVSNIVRIVSGRCCGEPPFELQSLCLWVVACGRLVCLLNVGKPHTMICRVDASVHVVAFLLLSVVVVACCFWVAVLRLYAHVLSSCLVNHDSVAKQFTL